MAIKIKLLTYNICHGMDYTDAKNPNFERNWLNINLNKNANAIKNSCAEIVCLNEIYNEGDGLLNKQPEFLASEAGIDYHTFAEALRFGNNSYGNAILSKYKIIQSKTFLVPAPVGDERRENENEYYEDRAVLKVVVDVNGVLVSVYATHFGLNLLEQERMVSTLLNCFETEKNPYILMGDFNAEPSESVLTPIFNKMQSVQKAMGNNQKTFSTFNEQIQIDYIFVSKEFTPNAFTRIECNASDHYPCLAEVTLNI